jgi:hypothetical protein
VDVTYSSNNMQWILHQLIVMKHVFCLKWMDNFCRGVWYCVIFSYAEANVVIEVIKTLCWIFLCLGDVLAKNPRLPIDSPNKTTRKIYSSKKMKSKVKRNQSAPYVSGTTGRNIPGCEVGPPCKCKRNKCWSLLHGGDLHTFNNFWNLRDFNIQNAYVFSCIKATGSKRVYLKKYQNLSVLGEIARFRIIWK